MSKEFKRYVVVFSNEDGELCSGEVCSPVEPESGDKFNVIKSRDENGTEFVSSGKILEAYAL